MPKMIALVLMPLLLAVADDHGAPFDQRRDPAFGDARKAIARFLASAVPRPRGPQHFCVVGYNDGESRRAWVHWREGKALILWEGSADPVHADDALILSRRQLDLNTDVVPTSADIAGSTYRIDRLWLDRTLADCAARGTHYAVTAPPRTREGGE
jgi:hypothetical protein